MTLAAADVRTLAPQAGPQWDFASTTADIAFMGGAAGGGKTFQLVLEPLRYIRDVKGFGSVFFRRTSKQITAEGGPWDESQGIYRAFDGRPRENMLDWIFEPYGNRVSFSHLEHEKDIHNWDGAQIPLILWDQLESFTRQQFFYVTFSRNRSTCGVRPYTRASYNPKPPDDPIGGWLHEFVSWYLDENDEYPVPEKSGVVRWFVNVADSLHWYETREAAVEAWPNIPPLSFTYIMSKVEDNKVLMTADPTYKARLLGLGTVERERLLKANHKIRAEAGEIFDRSWFNIIPAVPEPRSVAFRVRYWDKAGTKEKKARPETAYTAGLLLAYIDGRFIIEDMVKGRWDAAAREKVISTTAAVDAQKYGTWVEVGGKAVLEDPGHVVIVEQEPGSGGLESADATVLRLARMGIICYKDRPTGDKTTRADPAATIAEHEGIAMVSAPWNEDLLTILNNFPIGIRDPVDALSGGLNFILSHLQDVDEPEVGYDETAVEISPY